MKNTSIILVAALMALMGCSQKPTAPIEIRTVPVQRPALNLPMPGEVNMREITWIVVTPENYEEVFAKLRADGDAVALFAVTGSDYEDLSKNLNDIRGLLAQYQRLVVAYKAHYE